jgi:hypothetical protein
VPVTKSGFSATWNVKDTTNPVAVSGTLTNTTTEVATAGVNMMETSGKFYGTNAGYVGGGFEMMSTSGKTAIGAFGATEVPQ